jgi:molybdopterin-guanine dinucleotide biosynthesis adapter protein
MACNAENVYSYSLWMEHRMRVIGLAGWSGAGKTTLILKLIEVFRGRGLCVSTMKHAHHAFDIDRPGKDSFRHREAGAREVLISSARRWAVLHEIPEGDDEPRLGDLLMRLSPVDLVIVEGFKAYAHPKIAVHREANDKPLIIDEAPNVRAVASDAPLPHLAIPVLHLDDIEALADAAWEASLPRDEVVALLAATPGPERLRTPRSVAP